MEDATQASQPSQRTEVTAAQDTITQITQELTDSRKESDGKTKKLEEMTKKLDDMTNKSDDMTKKLNEITKKLDGLTKELCAERRQTKYLQLYITKMKAKYDGNKRHADQQEADHTERPSAILDAHLRGGSL